VLGATGCVYSTATPDEVEVPKYLRLMSNLSKDFPSNEFIMMLNNYNSVKEFDITHMNIRALDWYAVDAKGVGFPDIHGLHLDLVIELELLLVLDDD
jgi:hypothetical protein